MSRLSNIFEEILLAMKEKGEISQKDVKELNSELMRRRDNYDKEKKEQSKEPKKAIIIDKEEKNTPFVGSDKPEYNFQGVGK